ncbi:hypothetical protein AALA22_10560 [Anaerovoracaceae bacterium 41-7]
MENNTQETMRNTYITPVTDPEIPTKVAEKIEKEDEYDLVSSLLAAAEYQQEENLIEAVEIKRKGKLYFTVHLHPLSDEEHSFAMKKASKYYENPQGKKLPKVRGEIDAPLFNSWMIYLATTDEDKEKIWGNPAVMKKLGCLKPVETIGSLVTMGEKGDLLRTVFRLSKMTDDDDEEEISDEEYAKNSSR